MNHRGSAPVPLNPVSHWRSITASSTTVFITAGGALKGRRSEETAGKFTRKWAHYWADFQPEPFLSIRLETPGSARWRTDEGRWEETIQREKAEVCRRWKDFRNWLLWKAPLRASSPPAYFLWNYLSMITAFLWPSVFIFGNIYIIDCNLGH